MHRAMLSDDDGILCGLSEALEVNRLIEAVERASRSGNWIAA